jgi:hypothetical protein
MMPICPPIGAPLAELAPEDPPPSTAVEFERKEREGARECAGRMAAQAARGLQPCFERPSLSGRYEVSFVVSGDGRAASVKVSGLGAGETLVLCLRGMLGPLRFARFEGPPAALDGGTRDGGMPVEVP